MRTVAVAVALCVVLSVAPATAAGADSLGSETFATSPIDADRVALTASVAGNGDAQWSVAYRVELTTEDDTAAFESLASDIRQNRSEYLSAFRDRMVRTVRTAANATGREMAIENLSVSTTTEGLQGYGIVTYHFRWTNFAAVEGDQIRVGDALGGFFLDTDSRLVVSWPEGYEATSVSPGPDERTDQQVAWSGPVEFGDGGPLVVASPASGGLLIPAIGLLLLLALAAGGLYLYRRRATEGSEMVGDSESTTEESDSPTPPPTDDELLSNEERVLGLLEEEGGRVKQQTVAQRFDWTDAKTSQVVSSLREDERVEVFRLGRENVIVLPEESDL